MIHFMSTSMNQDINSELAELISKESPTKPVEFLFQFPVFFFQGMVQTPNNNGEYGQSISTES